jgi:hypothetical protein
MQAQPQRIGDGEDIGEQDGRIQGKAPQGLQRDLAGQLGGAAQGHEIPGAFPHRAVLRQVTARLAHHPHRGAIHRLAGQRTQKTVVDRA